MRLRSVNSGTVLGVAVILGLTCAQVQAGPKRSWGDRTSGRDLDAFRYDIREAERLRREIEARESDALADLRAAADAPSSAAHHGATIRWTFDILTIWSFGKHSTVKREPYGVFASRDECGKARAKKIAGLDEGNSRQPHLLPDQPTITTSITIGTMTSTSQRPGGPTETMNVPSCRAESFATVAHQKN
jgi:hypothetical protein